MTGVLALVKTGNQSEFSTNAVILIQDFSFESGQNRKLLTANGRTTVIN